jgi:4-hydroxy-tetrahydrodipicolinate synthase
VFHLRPVRICAIVSSVALIGVYNITPTPFSEDGSLDIESLERLTVFTREKGVNGMTILGVLGEADKLTESERDRIIATTVDTAGSGFPICVGTTHAGTDGCIAYSRRAQELARRCDVAPPRRRERRGWERPTGRG